MAERDEKFRQLDRDLTNAAGDEAAQAAIFAKFVKDAAGDEAAQAAIFAKFVKENYRGAGNAATKASTSPGAHSTPSVEGGISSSAFPQLMSSGGDDNGNNNNGDIGGDQNEVVIVERTTTPTPSTSQMLSNHTVARTTPLPTPNIADTKSTNSADAMNNLFEGVCSIWTINVEKGRKAYRYDVDIVRLPMPKRNGKLDNGRSLVEGADDGQKALHRNLCIELFTIAFKKTSRFGMTNGNEIIYDSKACLFTSCPIKDQNIDIENHEVNDYVKAYCGDGRDVRFNIRIMQNKACPELDLNNFEQYESGDSVFREVSLRTFFEMAILQNAMNDGRYVNIDMNCLFEADDSHNESFRMPVDNGMILRAGIGVRVICNDCITPKTAVVLDTKVAAFFEAKPLIETVKDILLSRRNTDFGFGAWAEVERIVKYLRVEVTYKRTRTFELGKLTDKPLRDIFIDVECEDGGSPERMNIPTFFQRRWHIELKYPDLPGFYPNDPVTPGRKPEVFPLEVLSIMKDQRVPRKKTDRKLMDQLLKYYSQPNDQMKLIWERARSLSLFNDSNVVLRAFGLSVDQKSNRIHSATPNHIHADQVISSPTGSPPFDVPWVLDITAAAMRTREVKCRQKKDMEELDRCHKMSLIPFPPSRSLSPYRSPSSSLSSSPSPRGDGSRSPPAKKRKVGDSSRSHSASSRSRSRSIGGDALEEK